MHFSSIAFPLQTNNKDSSEDVKQNSRRSLRRALPAARENGEKNSELYRMTQAREVKRANGNCTGLSRDNRP